MSGLSPASPTGLLGSLLPARRRYKTAGAAALVAIAAYGAHAYSQQQRRAARRRAAAK